MTADSAILSRLQTGRPVLIGSDPAASLRARGVDLTGDAALGRLVREAPTSVAEFYEQDIASGADIVCALTGDTMPRALAQIGMAFRSAALTGAAVDLAHDAVRRAPRPVAVAGMLGAGWIAPREPDRIAEEYAMHAARLAAAECEILIGRGCVGAGNGSFSRPPPAGASSARDSGSAGRLTRMAAVMSGSSTRLPVWALVDVGPNLCTHDGESVEDCARAVLDAGAHAVLLEVPDAAVGLAALARLPGSALAGALLAAPPSPPEGDVAELWAEGAKQLIDAGARILGGGAGVTSRHLLALARALGKMDRASFWPRAL